MMVAARLRRGMIRFALAEDEVVVPESIRAAAVPINRKGLAWLVGRGLEMAGERGHGQNASSSSGLFEPGLALGAQLASKPGATLPQPAGGAGVNLSQPAYKRLRPVLPSRQAPRRRR